MIRARLLFACAAAAVGAAPWAGCSPRAVSPAVSVSVEPLEGKQGETVTLIIRGERCDFTLEPPAVSLAEGGDGLSPGEVYVDSPGGARLRLAVMDYARSDARHIIEVRVGARSFPFAFRVIAAPKQASALFDPDVFPAGFEKAGGREPLSVRIEGSGTHFKEGETLVTFPETARISIEKLTVFSPTSALVQLWTSAASPEMASPATVTTGAETVAATFRILPSVLPLLRVAPSSIVQGEEEDIVLVVENMAIAEGDLAVDFPFNAGLSADLVVRVSGTAATARVTARAGAARGVTSVRLRSGGKEVFAQFRVVPTAAGAPFLRLFPCHVSRGERSVELQVAGYGTRFAAGATEVTFDPPDGVSLRGLTVLSPDRLVAIVDVDPAAGEGQRTVAAVTGDETAEGVLSVVAASSASVSLSPASVRQGESAAALALTARGIDLSSGTPRFELPPGSGVRIASAEVRAPDEARLVLDVAPGAPTGPLLLQVRAGSLSAAAPFSVEPADGVPSFTVSPAYAAVPSREALLTLHGTGTSWAAGAHALAAQDPSVEVVRFEVIDAATAEAALRVPPWVDARRCVLYVYSAESVEGAWLALLGRPHRRVELLPRPSVTAGDRGTSLIVRGTGTGFVNGLTTAQSLYGSAPADGGVEEGIRIDGVTAVTPSLLVVTLSVYSTSLPSDYALLVLTGAEAGPATVTLAAAADAPSLRFDPGAIVAGTGDETIRVTGSATRFDPSLTRFEPALRGVAALAVTNLDVADAEHADVTLSSGDALTDAALLVPVVMKTDTVIAGSTLAILPSAAYPWPAVEGWSMRRGETAIVVLDARGAVDFAASPPVVESLTPGVTAGTPAVAGSRLTFDALAGSASTERVAWFAVSSPGAYAWRIARYIFEPVPAAAVASPTLPFASGTEGMDVDVAVDGWDVDDGSLLDLASVTGAAFVEAFAAAGPRGLGVELDLALAAGDAARDAFLLVDGEFPGGGPGAGAIPVLFTVKGSAVQYAGVPSVIAGTLPPGSPLYMGFTPGAGQRVLLSWSGGRGGEPAGMRLMDAGGIGRLSSGGAARFVVGGDVAAPLFVAMGGGAGDAGKAYELSLRELPWGGSREAEPNDDVARAQGVGIAGTNPPPLRGSIGGAADRDYYTFMPDGAACVELLASRMAPAPLSGPFLAAGELDGDGRPLGVTVGSPAGEGTDPVVCREAGGRFFVALEALAGTTGEYLLFTRPHVVVNEVAAGLGGGSFVELHCADAEGGCPGRTVRVLDLGTGAELLAVTLGAFPADGYMVLAAGGGVEGRDAVHPALAALDPPFSVRVCAAGGTGCDGVQVGGTAGGGGEGAAPLDGSETAWQRLWHIDTDDNARDFVIDLSPTPGSPNK